MSGGGRRSECVVAELSAVCGSVRVSERWVSCGGKRVQVGEWVGGGVGSGEGV